MLRGFLCGVVLFSQVTTFAVEAPVGASVADTLKNNAHPPNCLITVTSLRKSGEKSTRVFRIRQPSKTECARAAKLHETNYAPHAVAKKTVTFKWVSSE